MVIFVSQLCTKQIANKTLEGAEQYNIIFPPNEAVA